MAKKVLFITYKLQKYRLPIFDLIGQNDGIDLTIAHSGNLTNHNSGFFEEKIIKYKKIGRFTYYNKSFTDLVKNYDAVVCMFYLQNLSFLKLALKNDRKFKLIFWGIGVRASYNTNFDSPTIMNELRYFLARKSDAMIFYTQYAKEKYMHEGIDDNKLFVMQNTVEVISSENHEVKRDKILFVGSLYKKKKIFELLEAYKESCHKSNSIPNLHIVGNGEEYAKIKDWIKNKKLEHQVILHGAIYEEEKLSKLFLTSLACISPGQAGLSVLKSFGYGTPFITYVNAITGGERLNIEHNKNGVLFDNYDQLKEIIINISENPEKYKKMGENAQKFYFNNRTPKIMASGFIKAVNYVI